MNPARALYYFVQEACQSLVRSWKVSAVAMLAMGVSLFLCGMLLLFVQNLSSMIESSRSSLRVVVYLRAGLAEEDYQALQAELASPAWIRSIERVSSEQAAQRFSEAFPSLAHLGENWGESPFPPSLEAVLGSESVDDEAFEAWLRRLREDQAASMVDADRDWLDQLSTLLGVLSAAGFTLGLAFLVAAALTGSSVLRLIAHLHWDEISIMRLVGATEFYVRGPFYVEGLLHGLGGAVLALAALGGVRFAAIAGDRELLSTLLFSNYLSLGGVLAILGVGAATGLVGAVMSLRRNTGDEDLAS